MRAFEGIRRFLRGGGPPRALLAAGALAAGGIWTLGVGAQAGRAPAPERSASGFFAPPPTACARGPASTSDIEQAPGGYPRFPFVGAGDFHEFYFTRAMYSDGSRGGFGRGRRGGQLGDRGPAWSIDYASADRHMMLVTQRLSNIDACLWEHPVSLADPELRRFPFVYSLEWGNAQLTAKEIEGLRGYLLAGGFLMIDDFWGSYQWENFAAEIRQVLPGRAIVEVPRDNLLFHIHYTIDGDILQVPNIGRGQEIARGYTDAPTWEQDGYVPHVRGIFDDDGRLMVVINWNTDLGDALEHAENPYYPLKFSTFASEMFLNMIMYSMSH